MNGGEFKSMRDDELYREIDRRRNALQRAMSELARRPVSETLPTHMFQQIRSNLHRELGQIARLARRHRVGAAADAVSHAMDGGM